MTRNYLDWLTSMPYSVYSKDSCSFFFAKRGTCDQLETPIFFTHLEVILFSFNFEMRTPKGYLWLEESTRDLGPWSLWPGRYQGGTEWKYELRFHIQKKYLGTTPHPGCQSPLELWTIFSRESRTKPSFVTVGALFRCQGSHQGVYRCGCAARFNARLDFFWG